MNLLEWVPTVTVKVLQQVDPKKRQNIKNNITGFVMTKKEQLEELHKKIDKLQNTVDKLSQSLYKHIKFIDSTYDGLKNPIEAARKWLRK